MEKLTEKQSSRGYSLMIDLIDSTKVSRCTYDSNFIFLARRKKKSEFQ